MWHSGFHLILALCYKWNLCMLNYFAGLGQNRIPFVAIMWLGNGRGQITHSLHTNQVGIILLRHTVKFHCIKEISSGPQGLDVLGLNIKPYKC